MSQEAQIRSKVLSAWGKQPQPLVLAPTAEQARYWLVQNDDFLTAWQGSYDRMIVTEHSPERLRGYRGTLVIVVPERAVISDRWVHTIGLIGSSHGISTWTERLP